MPDVKHPTPTHYYKSTTAKPTNIEPAKQYLPLSQITGMYTPEQIEKLYPGFYAPFGYAAYAQKGANSVEPMIEYRAPPKRKSVAEMLAEKAPKPVSKPINIAEAFAQMSRDAAKTVNKNTDKVIAPSTSIDAIQ